MKFEKITIVGLGLIGGSLAWALKESKQVKTVVGVDPDKETVKYALGNGIIDEGSSDISEGVEGAEIVVIATHVGIIPDTAKSIFESATEGAIITDVGSVKSSIVKRIESDLPEKLHFVGGHPIAGTEHSGVKFADSNLFNARRCILTPTQKTETEAVNKISKMWEALGSQVYEMDPETHDHIFSIVSHLPHLIAFSLVNTVLNAKDNDELMDFAGGGLKDYTRVAASSPEMWTEIFKANKDQLLEAISKFKGTLKEIEQAIENEDFESLRKQLENAARTKRSL
ncbi:MAG: prephenate dehydrogenase/arogenate dehydrogenase family protein [Thermodesulfobacteriota bacterium]